MTLTASAQEPKVALEKPAQTAEAPFTIELLETHVRFEADGSCRRVVHTIIKIHTEEGARQFARLNFDYNRAFEQVEIPLLRVLHANGGSTEILPSAVSDQPHPAVADAPAYHDVRRKFARVLGLQPADTLEYRVVTTVSHHPLAPDFWLTHSFARSETVTHETFELDLPASRQAQMRINPETPAVSERSGEGPDARVVYRWLRSSSATSPTPSEKQPPSRTPDLELSTFTGWQALAERLAQLLQLRVEIPQDVAAKAADLVQDAKTLDERIRANYEFVSQKIRTVSLPLGATGFRTRAPSEILASGYASPEDKHVLFAALNNSFCGPARAALVVSPTSAEPGSVPRPGIFDYLLTETGYPSVNFWMDLSLEVAPYQMISAQLRGRRALMADPALIDLWTTVPESIPFHAAQRVNIAGSLDAAGKLTAHVKYALRGDNELVLRIAFHRAERKQWKGLAQLLAISDGFRGEVNNVVVSDPLATREPFTVEYDIGRPRFANWSKSPARLPIPLPTLGLPEAPAKASPSASPAIDLGTPLEVQTQLTLRLPPRTTVRAPVPTSVQRDYAEFASAYSTRPGVFTASRRLKFLLRAIPASRAQDYAAFIHAVQNDEAQELTLERAPTSQTTSRPAAPHKPN
jgi:hypothetical protein